MEKQFILYNVFLKGKVIDTVLFGKGTTEVEAKRTLILEDGYSSDIVLLESEIPDEIKGYMQENFDENLKEKNQWKNN
jgi:hypothetical protein